MGFPPSRHDEIKTACRKPRKHPDARISPVLRHFRGPLNWTAPEIHCTFACERYKQMQSGAKISCCDFPTFTRVDPRSEQVAICNGIDTFLRLHRNSLSLCGIFRIHIYFRNSLDVKLFRETDTSSFSLFFFNLKLF